MTAVPIQNDEHWHSLRQKNVGASEVACLFDQSPWVTAFSLWHYRAGNAEQPRSGNSRMDWGKRLQPAIARGISEDMRWTLEESKVYHTNDNVVGMGCTLDYDIIDHVNGPGVVEIKFVTDYARFKEQWSDTRAPVVYELQLQHQLACTGRPWGAIGVFVGQTATLKIYERKADARVQGEIIRRIEAFWQSIKEGKAPDATGTAEEYKLLAELYPAIARGETIRIPDEKLSEECQLFLYGSAQRKSGEDIEKSSKVKLFAALGKAELALLPHYTVRQRPHGKGRVLVVEERETGIQHAMIEDTVELA